ncbi:MAG: hypothetical protein JWO82_2523 [Akkermansiaceae bacterium]|nr:hypothetical protein [Akkermansiaceae bacterium]
MTTKASILLTAATVLLLSRASAVPVLTTLPIGSTIISVSGDGRTVLGSDSAGSFTWTQAGGRVALAVVSPVAISGDGTAFAGAVFNDGQYKAYRWTQAGGYQYIPGLAGINMPPLSLPPTASGMGISRDGSTVLGNFSTVQTDQMAFKWVAGTSTSLGDLSGGIINSNARVASADGTVIGGESWSSNGSEAFAVVGNGAIQALGNVGSAPPLPSISYSSSVRGISADGSTLVGFGNLFLALSGESQSVPRPVAVSWTKTGNTIGGITLLRPISYPSTTLASAGTQAAATNSDGTAIVGLVNTRTTINNGLGHDPTYTFATSAAIWSGISVHKRLSDALTAAGLTINEAIFRSSVGISDDADTIVGNGDFGPWIVTGARSLFGLSSLDVVLPKVSVLITGGSPVVTYDTLPGQSYQVQRSTTLGSDWVNLGAAFPATQAGTNAVTDTTAPAGEKAFYRVTVQAGS